MGRKNLADVVQEGRAADEKREKRGPHGPIINCGGVSSLARREIGWGKKKSKRPPSRGEANITRKEDSPLSVSERGKGGGCR